MINEKLDWFKAFIKFQEKTLKPIHYFHSQERYFPFDLASKKTSKGTGWASSRASSACARTSQWKET